MRLGIISDTHGVLREEVIEKLQDCDYIIHAGDVGSQEIITKLDKIAKTFVVRGTLFLFQKKKIKISGFSIY